jgi:type IV pilus assembly protein PilE
MQGMPSPALNGSRRASSGFTLIEVMVVVAIVAILAAIAYPSYTQYVRRGARAEARTALLEAQQFMERFYAANARYTSKADGTGNPALPARLASIPTDTPRYDMTVSATSTGYRLTATPRAGGMMASDACGALTITNTGVRGAASGVSASDCWR